MQAKLRAVALLGAALLLGMAAYERTDGDPTSAADPALSGSAGPEVRQPSANAADSQRTAVADPRVTPQSQFVGPPCYPTVSLGLESWIADQFVQWSPDGDQILFTQGANLYGVSEDGARRTQVARGSLDIPDDSRGVIGGMMAFDISPDGKQVAYSTCEYPKRDIGEAIEQSGWSGAVRSHSYQIAAATIEGRRPQLLTNHHVFHNYPSWSPDGERIAFLEGGDPLFSPNEVRLVTMAADGTDRRVIIEQFDSLALQPPQWSPDGQRLAFVGDDGLGMGIYTVRADGSDLRRLTDALSGPSWSPDGERIAFATADGREVAIHTMAADGMDQRRIAAFPEVEWDPATRPLVDVRTLEWSPDGSKILFLENRALAREGCWSPSSDGVYVVGADGSGLVGLGISDPEVYSYAAAAWSPDGTRIAVLADRAPAPVRGYIGADSCDYAEVVIEGDVRPLMLFTMAADGADVEVLAQANEDGTPTGAWTIYADELADVAACSEGTVVADPEANPGLVRDCEILIGLRDVLLLGPTTNSWAVTPIEDWMGVTVEGSPARVTGLTFGRLRISGAIPPQVGELSELRILDLSENSLHGAIPSELGRLQKLERLELQFNSLSGKIPAALGQLANLKWLVLNSNGRLVGEIPRELGQLSELQVLNLGGNDLTGPIPPGLRELAELEVLDLRGNKLTGGIPAWLGGLRALKSLDLSRNELTGGIPAWLDQLTALESLGLSLNKLTGGIPAWLGQLTALKSLSLSNNDLTGEIPAELGRLTSLELLYLGGNRLTGEIPAEFGQLADSLTVFYVGGNRLTGCLPVGLRGIENNDLAELELPDCEAVESDGQPSRATVSPAVEQEESDPRPAVTPGSVGQRPAERPSGWWALLAIPLALAVAGIVRVVLRWRSGG